MIISKCQLCIILVLLTLALSAHITWAASPAGHVDHDFPRSLSSYQEDKADGLTSILLHRIRQEPFNLVATIIFFCAILHTFLTSRFLHIAHKWGHAHAEKKRQGLVDRHSVSIKAGLFHFLGEIEVVFGIWAVALMVAIVFFYDIGTAVHYISQGVNYTEPMFVVVIMLLASTRPILLLAETIMLKIAALLGGTLTALWFTILTMGPILGSFITEPAAMIISALLLSRLFYDLSPSPKLKYATIGLLFVNVSVGGTFSNFAAPPILMVAGPWEWGMGFMLANFGWKALVGILAANGIYLLVFRAELKRLQAQYSLKVIKNDISRTYLNRSYLEKEIITAFQEVDADIDFRRNLEERVQTLITQVKEKLQNRYLAEAENRGLDKEIVREAFEQRFDEIRVNRLSETLPALLPEEQRPPFLDPKWDERDDPVPAWMTLIHVSFMVWTIVNSHHPALFIAGLLFFVGFAQVTSPFQNRVDLKPALLVGFFLGGLVVHGGVQGWWIAPVLGALTEIPLMLSATILTAFNDNAAITFLATLVPNLTDSLKYAVVAGAVTGGGLTVIANAPNPAGISILKKHFARGVSPLNLLLAALLPTIIVWLCFRL